MKPEVPLDGDETDAFSRYSRRIIRWARGEVKKIKKRYNKRVRRRYKQGLKTYSDAQLNQTETEL